MTHRPDQASVQEILNGSAFGHALLASTADCVKLLSPDGRLLFISEAGRRLLELPSSDDLLDRPWADVWPAAHRTQAADAVLRATTGEVATFQGYCPTAAGTLKWWDVTVTPLRDAAGAVTTLLAVSRDQGDMPVRDREARRVEVELFENAFQHAPIAVALVSLEGGFLKLNQAFCDLLQYDEATLLALDFQSITHPADLGADLENLGRLLAGEVAQYQMDKRYRRRDGSQVWVNLSVSLVRTPDGRPKHFIAQVQDLTKRRAAQRLYRLMSRTVGDVVAVHDIEGTCLFISPAALAVYGYIPSELIGKRGFDMIHPAAHEELHAKHAELAAQPVGTRSIQVLPVMHKDGRIIWAEVAMHLAYSDDGERTVMVSVTRDVTDRVESERRYRLMAENITDIIVTTGLDGRATYVSPSVASIGGWTPAQIIGGRSVDFAHPDDVERMESAFRAVVAGDEGVRVRWRGRRADGGWVWLESSPSLIGGGELGEEPQFLDVMRDVSAQVAQENALAEATEAAEAAAAAKAEFLANMSHEIRTPLTAVLGFAGLLGERKDLSDQARTYVDRIGSASRGLLAIVNDVLDFSSLEQGRVDLKPRGVSAVEMARDALLMFKGQADDKGLLLELETALDASARVLVDPERVRQVLLNLIGNAVKFTEVGGVTVRLSAAAGRLAVEVRDTGAGLDDAQQDKLFQRFSQVDASSTRRHGGTGLGLAICKGLVEAMDGAIGVSSTRGEGSVFRFEIAAPLVAEDAVAAPQEDAGMFPIEGVRVLVADDNFANRELVRAMLERLGAEVTDVADGLEAVEAAKLMPYDVILMDLRMPRMSGPEALARLRREDGPNQAVPVVAFSAEADPALKAEAGFDGFIAKPIDAGHLVKVVWAAAFGELDDDGGEVRHA